MSKVLQYYNKISDIEKDYLKNLPLNIRKKIGKLYNIDKIDSIETFNADGVNILWNPQNKEDISGFYIPSIVRDGMVIMGAKVIWRNTPLYGLDPVDLFEKIYKLIFPNG